MKRNCQTCAYSEPVDSGIPALFCRRYPPRAVDAAETILPIVDFSDWCGEWARKIEPIKESRARVDARVSISRVLGRYVRVSGADGVFSGECPFGDDPHLFRISERSGTYFCDTCCSGGNAVRFLMLHQDLSFHDAVRQAEIDNAA